MTCDNNVSHAGDEPVAPLRDRLYVSLPVRVLAKRLSQQRDVLSQGIIVDEGVRPHLANQLFLPDNMPAVPYQCNQSVEGLGSHLDGPAVQNQKPLGRI